MTKSPNFPRQKRKYNNGMATKRVGRCQGCELTQVIHAAGLCWQCWKQWDDLDRKAGGADRYIYSDTKEREVQRAMKADAKIQAKAKPKPAPPPPPARQLPDRPKAEPMTGWEMLGKAIFWKAFSQNFQSHEWGIMPGWPEEIIKWILEEAGSVGIEFSRERYISVFCAEDLKPGPRFTARAASGTLNLLPGAKIASEASKDNPPEST